MANVLDNLYNNRDKSAKMEEANLNQYVTNTMTDIRTEPETPGSGGSNPPQQPTPPTPTPEPGSIEGDKKSYSPNSEGLSNTGAGAESAIGSDGKPIGYSWEKTSADKAQKQYIADVLAQKQTMLTNRQNIANNAVNYQAQADMMKYQNNQNAEKVGWTGGYVMDQNRQMEYLKQSIQAQMYGAIELQKYGYDSSLAAARLSYDLNQQEYARQYYEQAVSTALSEAQLTGTYFSAETKDMMAQMSTADQNLMNLGAIDKDGNPVPGFNPDNLLSSEDREAYDRAVKIKDSITNWFSTNKISKEGVKTLESWQADQANELNWTNELWTRYQAALESANQDISTIASAFIRFDGNDVSYSNGIVNTIDFSLLSDSEIKSYYEDGDQQKQQVASYFRWMLQDIVTKNTKVVNTETGETKVNQDKIDAEAAALAKRYKEITGLDLDISNVVKKTGTGTSGSESSGSGTSQENWDIINNFSSVTDLTKLKNFNMYNGFGKHWEESKIQGDHLKRAKLLNKLIQSDEYPEFRNVFFDFNDSIRAGQNSIYLYIDASGNMYVLDKDTFNKYAKEWFYIQDTGMSVSKPGLNIWKAVKDNPSANSAYKYYDIESD